MPYVLIAALAAALAALTYRRFEALSARAWLPMALRAVAWGALGVLILNPGCAGPADRRPPVVLLDGSLSMTSIPGRWPLALDTARALGDVRWFGDARPASDSLPDRGQSDLAPALAASAASGRRVVVVTDGELGDAAEIPADLLTSSGIVVLPRPGIRDLAVGQVTAPRRITAGDSFTVSVEVRLAGEGPPDSAVVELSLGGRLLGRRAGLVAAGASVPVTFRVGSRGIPPGSHLIRAALVGAGDAEPRDDARLVALAISATPGIVLLADPGDWDSKFLYRTLRGVADLPVKGYVRVDRDRWRNMDDLKEVPDAAVRSAARGADILVLRGLEGGIAADTRARGILRWPPGVAEGGGDWYLSPVPGSPVAMAFFGAVADSLPPASGTIALTPAAGDWVGATAQLGRRGSARPVFVGHQEGRRRTVTVGIEGLWRWVFRGGPSAEAYRATFAAAVSWLLAAPDSAGASARLVRPVVEQGMPFVFQRTTDALTQLPIAIEGPTGPRADTLRFGGDGLASLWLPPGSYRFLLGGRSGAIAGAVDVWSREWIRGPAVVTARPLPAAESGARRSIRDLPWLYLLLLASLAGEWVARRRLGLR